MSPDQVVIASAVRTAVGKYDILNFRRRCVAPIAISSRHLVMIGVLCAELRVTYLLSFLKDRLCFARHSPDKYAVPTPL
jgi:hypothetical protein